MHQSKSRVLAIAAAAAAIAAAAAATGALAQEQVTFATNWLPQAEHGGYYQAVADGTYEACGLEVEIKPGGPQVNNRALLIAGRVDFHMGGNLLQAFSAVAEDIPMVVVAAHFQKEPQVILTHPDGPFDTFEGMAGEAKMIIGDNGFQSFYQWMMDEFGFTEEQRAVYTFNAAPFLADKNSAQQGYLTSEPYSIETEGGFTPTIYLLADYGFDTYATTVETMQATIDGKPEVVQCFLDGSAIGWTNYLYGDASAGDALIQAANPEMTDERLAYSRDKMREYGIVDSGESETLGIGAMTDERFKSFYDKMVKAEVAPEGIDLSKVYTLEFVNKGVGLEEKKKLTGG